MSLNVRTAIIFSSIYALRAVIKIKPLVPNAVAKKPNYCYLLFPLRLQSTAGEELSHHLRLVHLQAVFHELDICGRVLQNGTERTRIIQAFAQER